MKETLIYIVAYYVIKWRTKFNPTPLILTSQNVKPLVAPWRDACGPNAYYSRWSNNSRTTNTRAYTIISWNWRWSKCRSDCFWLYIGYNMCIELFRAIWSNIIVYGENRENRKLWKSSSPEHWNYQRQSNADTKCPSTLMCYFQLFRIKILYTRYL